MDRKKTTSSLTGGLLLIGMAILFLVKEVAFFPWILAVIGVAILPSTILKKGWQHSLTGSTWLIGLAICFYFNVIWPGVLILVGLTLIFEGLFPKIRGNNVFEDE